MTDSYRKIMVEGKKIKEHRAIIEKRIGRKLSIHEIVHHKNGNKKDNRLSNLQIMTTEEHTSLHHAGKRKAIKKEINQVPLRLIM